jgi:hypothetical protein
MSWPTGGRDPTPRGPRRRPPLDTSHRCVIAPCEEAEGSPSSLTLSHSLAFSLGLAKGATAERELTGPARPMSSLPGPPLPTPVAPPVLTSHRSTTSLPSPWPPPAPALLPRTAAEATLVAVNRRS